MDAFFRACVLLLLSSWLQITVPYLIRNHPCCQEPNENLTLAMVIDAFEIYGHDPTDKLDNLWLYQDEMMRIKTAEDQYLINEHIHIASDHLGRFINLHIKELKVLLITLDDVLDNMLTMYENHNSIAAERKATYNGGPVPMEFYMSQEFYCGRYVYIFVSELYSDIYYLGKGVTPYCKHRSFVFLGFLHFHDEQKYYLMEDPSVSFPTDNYLHGLECHNGICIFRFPFKKITQKERDISAMPKAIVKCGLVMYKLPPLSAASCIVTSGSFILDFNIQGLRYRHHDYLLTMPNGHAYYTKEAYTPLVCDHHVCEWNYTNHYGGPFVVPGDPSRGEQPPPPYIEPTQMPTPEPEENNEPCPFVVPGDPSRGVQPPPPYIEPTQNPTPTAPEENDEPLRLEGCLFMYPPNYGSIAGISYLDRLDLHDDRFTCNSAGGTKGLYWYPQWMGAPPHHPYPTMGEETGTIESPGPFYPHQFGDNAEEDPV